ncbi:MAG: hypothetical protein KAQ95_10830 [Candidatus Heimdallarchaeota archaeon]|nr:hypothetical protein [Candidatus Heimdallarchaeota archaeon]
MSNGMNMSTSPSEVNRNLCQRCQGFRDLCGKGICPILVKAKSIADIQKTFSKTDFFGASPPGFFVGEYGYPKVSIGPLVPPIASEDTSIYDAEEKWIFKTMDEIIGYRTSLVRGKKRFSVKNAREPDKMLELTQELVMSSKPVDTEMTFIKRPKLDIDFSPRIAPSGPSGNIKKARLTENPKIPRIVDKIVSDTDLKAVGGITKLHDDKLNQRHITRLLSAGLFGVKKNRRLVPTTWSITAVDDILGKRYWKQILKQKWLEEVRVFSHKALGNLVLILMYPSAWMYEVFEYWLIGTSDAMAIDWETWRGRKTYAKDVAGAYYCTKLQVLEYLDYIQRQAGCFVYLQVDKEWIPTGVWRFREIAKEALKQVPLKFETLEQAFVQVKKMLDYPLEKIMDRSNTLKIIKSQRTLEDFFPKDIHG